MLKRFLHSDYFALILVLLPCLLIALLLAQPPQHSHDLHASPRSPHWPAVRAKWIAEHGECAVCGSKKTLQVHHIQPYHLHPELELDETNLITLCEGPLHCHLMFGHLGSFGSYNPDVKRDAETWAKKIKNRP